MIFYTLQVQREGLINVDYSPYACPATSATPSSLPRDLYSIPKILVSSLSWSCVIEETQGWLTESATAAQCAKWGLYTGIYSPYAHVMPDMTSWIQRCAWAYVSNITAFSMLLKTIVTI